jgi:hypothetical protein
MEKLTPEELKHRQEQEMMDTDSPKEETKEVQENSSPETNQKLFSIIEAAPGIKECKALGLKNIPHIGIYSFHYDWIPIISYFKGNGGENWDGIVPSLGKQAVKKLLDDNKFEINKIDYMCVNYNCSVFREKYFKNMKQRYVRFNMVFHPYLMSYLKPGVDEEK